MPTLASFTSGTLVISIVGNVDGTAYTDNQGTPIQLEELTTAGTVIGTLTLPQVTTVANGATEYAISGEYGSSSEGTLSLAADGQSLVIAGYGINAQTYNSGGAAVYGNAALAQTTSVLGGTYTAVPRVIADIKYNGAVDTTTDLYNVDNTNNPRSVASVNGTAFWLSGQGVKGDTTQGVVRAADGANAATAIDTSTDTRSLEISNGQLYVSRDSTQGTGGTSSISTYGGLPVSATAPTTLPGIGGRVTLTAAQANGVNNAAIGTSVSLSPENFFFANPTTLYVADGGNPKQGGLGDGGLQKWIFNGTAWNLAYTLASGLNLVADTGTSGSTGLIGLTGVVNGGSVQLYATNSTLGDLDQTYLYSITDSLAATTLPSSETFSVVATAAAGTNIRGVSFAPSASTAAPSTVSVNSGVTSTGLTVGSGSTLTVQSGGIGSGTTVTSGGSATVVSGGQDTASIIGAGATETVQGSAAGTQIEGIQIVSGPTASVNAATVYNGGVVDLFGAGATANNTTVVNGGRLVVSGSSTASNTVISSGGIVDLQTVSATLGGTVRFAGPGTIIERTSASLPTGVAGVISGFGQGDFIDLPNVTSDARLNVVALTSTTAANVYTSSTSQYFTFSGSVGSSIKLISDGAGGMELAFAAPPTQAIVVSSGVTSSGVTVTSGSSLTVSAGGTIVSAVVLSAGSALVSGTDNASIISAGGTETLLGTATGDTIYGTQIVSAATATATNETVFNGGALDLFLKGAVATGTVVSSGGTLNISGNASATNTTLNGGTINLQSPKAVINGGIIFNGPGTILESAVISSGFGASGVISGFGAGDAIDLQSYGSGAVLTSSGTGGNTTLTVTSGAAVAQSFAFSGAYTSGFFGLSPDGLGGVQIVATGVACYCPGTLITTPDGEVAVETLAIGDLVTTASGAVRPIRWLGRRSYAGRFAQGQAQILPVRIAAGALGGGLPRRDLFVSPLHAMLIDGVLVPASALVNNVSVVQLRAVERVDYIHIELDSHDVILAEGAASETFVDDHSRNMFHNAAEYAALYPDAAVRPARYCAPRIEDGDAMETIRARLAGAGEAVRLGALEGFIDEAGQGRVRGWVRDQAQPNEHVRLQVRAGGVVLCEVTADQLRPDLAAAGIGDGRHAFDVVIPGGLPSGATVRVQRAADGAVLAERRCA